MSNEQGRRIDDKRSQEAVDWSEVREVLSSHPMPAQAAATEQAISGKIEEIRALLSEAYGFKSTSKAAQDNINAALDLLDGLATPADAGAGRMGCDAAFDNWYAAQSHQLTNEQLCRLIWQRGWQACARLFVPSSQVPAGMDEREAFIWSMGHAAGQSPAPVTADAGAAADLSWLPPQLTDEMAEALEDAIRSEARIEWDPDLGSDLSIGDLDKIYAALLGATTRAAAPVSRDAVLEEAAWLCDRKYVVRFQGGHLREACEARSLAEEIRALKGKPQPVVAAAGEDARDAGWISVDERLPAEKRKVLVCFETDTDGEPDLSVTVGRLDNDGWKVAATFYHIPGAGQGRPFVMRETTEKVQYWMPLPPSPVESAKQGGKA